MILDDMLASEDGSPKEIVAHYRRRRSQKQRGLRLPTIVTDARELQMLKLDDHDLAETSTASPNSLSSSPSGSSSRASTGRLGQKSFSSPALWPLDASGSTPSRVEQEEGRVREQRLLPVPSFSEMEAWSKSVKEKPISPSQRTATTEEPSSAVSSLQNTPTTSPAAAVAQLPAAFSSGQQIAEGASQAPVAGKVGEGSVTISIISEAVGTIQLVVPAGSGISIKLTAPCMIQTSSSSVSPSASRAFLASPLETERAAEGTNYTPISPAGREDRREQTQSSLKSVRIKFQLRGFAAEKGQDLYVVGSVPELGNWNPYDALLLKRVDIETWIGRLTLDVREDRPHLEYKYIMIENGSVQWEGGFNKHRDLPSGPGELEFIDEWVVNKPSEEANS